MSITRWWSSHTGVARFDLVTRWQLYVLSASVPLVVVLLLGARPGGQAWAAALLLLVVTGQTVACLALLKTGIDHSLGGRRPAAWLLGATVLLTGAGLGAVVLAFPAQRSGGGSGSGDFPVGFTIATLLCGALTVAATPLLTTNRLIGLVVGPAAVVGLISQQPGLTLNYLLLVGIGVATYRFSIWYLGVAWEIDRNRDVQARLAVAEERLRFARDLHDSLGRNLTLIAVNTELASELIRREQDGALEHLLQVRRSAQDSMREMRAVVGGYRVVDLQSELAGARSVLRSAGIAVRVIGDAAELPEPVQAALGWVVREATTNIIRHSDAGTVKIDLDVVDDAECGHSAVLRIENDGVHSSRVNASNSEAGAESGGSGLIGLRERLSGLGGELIAAPEPGNRFILLARLPLAAAPRTAEPAQSKPRQSKPTHPEPAHSEPAQSKPAQ